MTLTKTGSDRVPIAGFKASQDPEDGRGTERRRSAKLSGENGTRSLMVDRNLLDAIAQTRHRDYDEEPIPMIVGIEVARLGQAHEDLLPEIVAVKEELKLHDYDLADWLEVLAIEHLRETVGDA